MTNKIGSGTAQGLIEFLDNLVEKGRAAKGSVTPLKTATRQVFSTVDGEDAWESINIKNVDVDDYIARFKNLTLGQYTDSSYKTYQSRLNKAKDWYTTFLVNPGWTPTSQPKRSRQNGSEKKEPKGVDTSESVEQVKKSVEGSVPTVSSQDLISYPFPLQNGKIVNLYLPVDLKLIDAKRIARFVESLCIDPVEVNK